MAYYGGFSGLIYTLQNWGVYDVILPFILIFTIVYAILDQTKILDSSDANSGQHKKFGTVIAAVLAFSVVGSHFTGYPLIGGRTIVEIMNAALPQVSLLLVAIVMVLLTLGLWTGKKADGKKGIGQIFTLASGALVIIIFIASMGWWNVPSWMWSLIHSDLIALVIAILVFGLIIKFITGSGKPAYESAEKYDEAQAKRRQARATALAAFLGEDSTGNNTGNKKD